jgi:osmotically-inducible protein OsmY
VEARDITVRTIDRITYLNGLVDNAYQRRLAGTVARQVPNVGAVINAIAVQNK